MNPTEAIAQILAVISGAFGAPGAGSCGSFDGTEAAEELRDLVVRVQSIASAARVEVTCPYCGAAAERVEENILGDVSDCVRCSASTCDGGDWIRVLDRWWSRGPRRMHIPVAATPYLSSVIAPDVGRAIVDLANGRDRRTVVVALAESARRAAIAEAARTARDRSFVYPPSNADMIADAIAALAGGGIAVDPPCHICDDRRASGGGVASCPHVR